MNSTTLTAVEEPVAKAVFVPRQRQHQHQHMPSLDGLRGVAVLLVLAHHFCASLSLEFHVGGRLFHWAEFGWTGVDLFFVLSGFLITGILYDAKAGSCFFKNFYARRALRIFPLYYVALTIVILLTPLLSRLKLEGSCSPAWMSIYATNFVISAKGIGSFGVLDHFWSLAVEEHFYLLWPTVVFFLDRKKLMTVSAMVCVIAPCLRYSIWDGGPTLPVGAYMLTPMRMDSLAAGAFISLWVRGPNGMKGVIKPAMIVAGTALTLMLAMVSFRHTKGPHDAMLGLYGVSVLWALFGATLLLALNWVPLKAVMSLPVLRWFGKYSYGMYVWHPVVFMLVFHNDLARHIRHGNGSVAMLLSAVIGIAGTLAVTMLSWHLWEKQFLKFKTRFA